MKQILTLIFLFTLAVGITAQNFINHRVLVKDADGNVLVNQTIDLRLTVIAKKGASRVYQETHSGATTDATGIVMINIGEGTPILNKFSNVAVSNSIHFVKTEVDINQDGTFVNLGTPQLIGHDRGRNSLNTNPGKSRSMNGTESIAMGVNTTASGSQSTAIGNTTTAEGQSSTAMGNSTYAQGFSSTAMGDVTQAIGVASTAMGRNSIASGNTSTAMGNFTEASGSFSTAIGYGTEASSHGEIAVGTFNETYNPNDPMGFDENDRLFVIGNGTLTAPSNALAVLKNGTITAPSLDISEITDAKALVTKEFMDASGGLKPIDEGNGIGHRIKSRDETFVGNIGQYGVDLSSSNSLSDTRGATGLRSIAMGYNTIASGFYSSAMGWETTSTSTASVAMGYKTTASNSYSTAMGKSTMASGIASTAFGSSTTASGESSTSIGTSTTASGISSTAMGENTHAQGNGSTAMGFNTIASGNTSTSIGNSTNASGRFSVAMGSFTQAESDISLAIGRYNVGGGTAVGWVASDPLFEVGIGTGSANKANALTILKNGDIGIVTDTPEAKIHISSGTDTGLGTNNGFLLLGETNGANISIDNNEIMAKNNGNAADLNLQIEGGRVLIGGNVGIGTTNPAELLHVDGIVRIGTETIEDTGTNLLSFDANLLPTGDNGLSLGTSNFRWSTVYATNGTINTSDRREKKNIKDLNYGLSEVLEMQPISFNWRDDNNPDLKLGLIAQDLQVLIPEVVKSHTLESNETTGEVSKKELERLGVYYSDLVPVLIKAIQEQQEIINAQNDKIDAIERKLDALLEVNNQRNN